jgi:hypothetical protein
MRIKKKKSIKELSTKIEQFIVIVNTGRSKDNIHTDYIAYRALKWRIDNSDSLHDDDDIRRMKDLHNVFLMGMNICNKQNKINAARKVAAAAAATAAATTAATIATSNLTHTSDVTNTSISTSASTLINGNEITASFELTPPPSSNTSTTSSLPSSNDETRASLNIISLSNELSILTSHSINEITTSFLCVVYFTVKCI